jgi:hypothetical protein
MLIKGSKIERGYATAVEDGVNYRNIAEEMTDMGHKMNHSSARNHIIRAMRRFVSGFAAQYDIDMDEKHIDEVARSPMFQEGMAELLEAEHGDREDT